MSGISESVSICGAVLRHINAWEQRPFNAALETLDTRAGGALLRPLTGAARTKEYVDGSYTGQLEFSLTLRLRARSSSERLEAIEALYRLGSYLESSAMPELGQGLSARSFSMLSTPCLIQRGEDGSEDYTAVYRLYYESRS